MENISKNEREASKATFSRVDVIQPNKIKKYMAVCKNCGLVVAENEADQHQHWYAPLRFMCYSIIYFINLFSARPIGSTVARTSYRFGTFIRRMHLKKSKWNVWCVMNSSVMQQFISWQPTALAAKYNRTV